MCGRKVAINIKVRIVRQTIKLNPLQGNVTYEDDQSEFIYFSNQELRAAIAIEAETFRGVSRTAAGRHETLDEKLQTEHEKFLTPRDYGYLFFNEILSLILNVLGLNC